MAFTIDDLHREKVRGKVRYFFPDEPVTPHGGSTRKDALAVLKIINSTGSDRLTRVLHATQMVNVIERIERLEKKVSR